MTQTFRSLFVVLALAVFTALALPVHGQQAPGKGMPPRPMGGPNVAVGAKAPEINAGSWINSDAALSLSGWQGSVVLVEFFATWCRPCVANIPHLNKLYEDYGAKGLKLVSLTQESRDVVDRFLARNPMKYPIGVASTSGTAYGVYRIPHAVLIGKDGNVRWAGHPGSGELDQLISAALTAK